jgi:hypothetical protein
MVWSRTIAGEKRRFMNSKNEQSMKQSQNQNLNILAEILLQTAFEAAFYLLMLSAQRASDEASKP